MELIEKKCILCGHCYAICPAGAITVPGYPSKESLNRNDVPNSLEKLLTMRRSIRHYKNQSVPRDLLDRIIDTVIHSPTGTNSRKTGITILDDRKKIVELSDIIMTHFRTLTKILLNPATYPILLLFLGKEKTRKIFAYKRLIPKYFSGKDILTHDAPVLMLFHSSKKASTPEQDALIWATSAMLLAESHGLGTCFNGFLVLGLRSCAKARKYIGLPRGRQIYETFTAGFPLYRYKRPVPREREYITYI
ncbi:nitroreductase family protein [Spirochaeta isovalerica]|uniref:Nitroreductase n=1 Tax=Spirochaeta isovalerica TaxID=150 RepID=A0A841R759_9SPIO|nr:nitroreductase family protein [Spirochaeta isovalerica]MBB6478598.1 nitroreductase [Spirochaeta isovalerica]